MTKYIFVTGGVVSGLGKGITAASLGRLLKARGLKVAAQKLDSYINVDPGTMSPYQHGEVYVTEDGSETDLDLGHYERFIDEDLNKYSNLTTGKVYWNVLNKERRGEYLGSTVQVIPHITNEIKEFVYRVGKQTDADIVIGVPDSGLEAALGFSRASGIPYGIGLIKNKYIGRTFISPGQNERMDQVRIKLSPVKNVIEGKRVVLIDDSIVRGTTSKRIVKLLREAGAKEIHMRISAPPFLHPCYYGTDIDSEENLIACHHSMEEIAEIIGVDSLGYLPLENLNQLVESEDYCAACFNGVYPTTIPTDLRKDRFERKLSERMGAAK